MYWKTTLNIIKMWYLKTILNISKMWSWKTYGFSECQTVSFDRYQYSKENIILMYRV